MCAGGSARTGRILPWANRGEIMNSRMRIVLAVVVLGCCAAVATPTPAGDFQFFLGVKDLGDEWRPNDRPVEVGFESSWGPRTWPVWIAVDVLVTRDRGDTDEQPVRDFPTMDLEAKIWTGELDLGLRKIWRVGRWQPYLGGGVGLIGAQKELEGQILLPPSDGLVALGGVGGLEPYKDSHTDGELGLWVGGGFSYRLGRRSHLGVSLRYSQASGQFFREDLETGGHHAGIVFGWGPAAAP